MHCMLDTGTCIYVFKGAPGIEPKVALEHCCISTVVLGELEYGVANSHPNRREQNEEALLDFISCIHILPVTDVVAKMYGSVRTQPYLKKQPIGPNDMWIAAHSLAEEVTLITNNTREFERVSGLVLDTWIIK